MPKFVYFYVHLQWLIQLKNTYLCLMGHKYITVIIFLLSSLILIVHNLHSHNKLSLFSKE